jgi:PKD repeat protein
VRIYNGKDNKGKLLAKCASGGGTSGLGPGYNGGYGSCVFSCLPGIGTKADTFKAGKQMYIEFAMSGGSTAPGFSAYYWTKAAKTSKPAANFITSFNDHGDTVCAGEIILFTSKSLGSNLSYFCDFDGSLSNGFESTKSSPSYGYLFPGNHVVTLVVSSCAGTDTFRRTIHVISPPKPAASFTADNFRPTLNDIVLFKSTIRTCVSSYNWSISKTYASATDTGSAVYNNGSNSSSANPSVSFKDTGYYTVTLSASSAGGSNSITQKAFLYVRASYCEPYVTTMNSDFGISGVVFGGIDNSSAQGSTDYTSYVNSGMSAYVQKGFSYPITIKRDSAFVSAETRAVYIDLNQDGNFVKMAEDVGNATNATWRANIKIPSAAKTGATTMRVAANYSSDTNNVCGGNIAGEYEDYRIYIIPDTVRPVITLIGPDTITLELGFTFVDTGMYSAKSAAGIDLTPKVKITNPGVKPGGLTGLRVKQGWNIINYDVTDSLGNKAITKYRYVYVLPDTMGPNLVIAGPDTLYVAAKNDSTAYVVPPKVISSVDLVDGTVLDTVSPTKIPINKLDTVVVKYSATDQAGNRTIVYRWVIVIDTTAPVLVLRGQNPVKVQVNTSYTDAGVDPIDDFFDVPHLRPLVVVSGSVDIHKVGTYILTYNVTNPYGLKAKPVTRTVEVIDTIRPVIKLNGWANDSVEVFTKYTDLGASGTDNYYSTVSITNGGSFYTGYPDGIPKKLGTYVAIYTATDSSGNKATVSRTIIVFDSVPPVISLKGSLLDSTCRWAAYTDSGYSVTDNYYKSVTAIDTEGNFMGTGLPGLYKLRYKATDSSGNSAYSPYRYIYVKSENDQGCLSGIKEGMFLDKYINVYPNPTTGLLHVTAQLPGNERIIIRITDAVGKELSLTQANGYGNTFEINLQGQPAGVYLLNISTAKAAITKELILAK